VVSASWQQRNRPGAGLALEQCITKYNSLAPQQYYCPTPSSCVNCAFAVCHAQTTYVCMPAAMPPSLHPHEVRAVQCC